MTCAAAAARGRGAGAEKLQGHGGKRLLDRLWDTHGMTHQGALAVRVPVEDAA
ncbi:MAG: hypothetical protein ACLSF6_09470 [Evtepia gabavorous]